MSTRRQPATTNNSAQTHDCLSCGRSHSFPKYCYLAGRVCKNIPNCPNWSGGGCDYHHRPCPSGILCDQQTICQFAHHDNYHVLSAEELAFSREYPNVTGLTGVMVLNCCLTMKYRLPVELRKIIINDYLYQLSPFTNDSLQLAVQQWYHTKREAMLQYGHISDWDTSHVTCMVNLFKQLPYFNEPIGKWNVSSVTDMTSIFQACWWFNQPIGNWDVSNVENMASMFRNTGQFNQQLANWNVNKVKSLSCMFYGAIMFNQPLLTWNISNVQYASNLFQNALSFNQPLDIWDTRNLKHMNSMFNTAVHFNQPLNNWNIDNVVDMSYMFHNAVKFNQVLSSWHLDDGRISQGIRNTSDMFTVESENE